MLYENEYRFEMPSKSKKDKQTSETIDKNIGIVRIMEKGD